MKKTLLIIILLLCVGCSNTKEKISQEEAYATINNMFHYDEEEGYTMEYYKQVKYKVDNKEGDYYAFFITSEKDNFSYYVLVDVYNQIVISPVLAEDIEQ